MNSPFDLVHTAELQSPYEEPLRQLEDFLNCVIHQGQDDAALDELAAQLQPALLAGHVQATPLAETSQAAGLRAPLGE